MPERYSPLWQLTLARIREVLREPGFVFWIFGFPVLMAVGLGIAFREKPPPKPEVAVVDSHGWLAAALRESERLNLHRVSAAQAIEQLRATHVDLVVTAGGSAPPTVRYQFDASRAEGRLARLAADAELQRALGREDAVSTKDQPITEKGARYIDFLLPGLIGLNLMGSSMWGIGFTIVMSRKRRQLRRFAATPMRRSHFLLAYLLSRLVFLAMELVGLVALGFVAFGVKVHGSPLALVLVALVGAACFGGVGLLVAARVQSIEAANGWMNFIMMPMWILCGTFFAYSRFPEVMQPFLRLLPLTALNDSLRAIVNDGISIAALGAQLAVLGAWGVVTFALALKWFRWQ